MTPTLSSSPPIFEPPPGFDIDFWRSLAAPQPSRVYVSTQGDFWDMIAIRTYGRRRGNEHLMFRLLENNYPLRELSQFPAGVPVIVPEVDVATDIPLVPWKKATRIPAA